MAQFELTLLDWAQAHRGAREYVAFADKCWLAFPEQFGFKQCYVNSGLAVRGIPVAEEDQGQIRLRSDRYFYGLPLRQHAEL